MRTERPHEQGQIVRAQLIQQARPPPQPGGRDADRADGVPRIVHAVTIRALAVFPGLAPVYGGEPDEHGVSGKIAAERIPQRRVELGHYLEGMHLGRIMADHGVLA